MVFTLPIIITNCLIFIHLTYFFLKIIFWIEKVKLPSTIKFVFGSWTDGKAKHRTFCQLKSIKHLNNLLNVVFLSCHEFCGIKMAKKSILLIKSNVNLIKTCFKYHIPFPCAIISNVFSLLCFLLILFIWFYQLLVKCQSPFWFPWILLMLDAFTTILASTIFIFLCTNSEKLKGMDFTKQKWNSPACRNDTLKWWKLNFSKTENEYCTEK